MWKYYDTGDCSIDDISKKVVPLNKPDGEYHVEILFCWIGDIDEGEYVVIDTHWEYFWYY